MLCVVQRCTGGGFSAGWLSDPNSRAAGVAGHQPIRYTAHSSIRPCAKVLAPMDKFHVLLIGVWISEQRHTLMHTVIQLLCIFTEFNILKYTRNTILAQATCFNGSLVKKMVLNRTMNTQRTPFCTGFFASWNGSSEWWRMCCRWFYTEPFWREFI